MEMQFPSSKLTQKAQVLAGTLTIAIVINLILLLLISSLINCHDSERIPTPTLRPVDFIRVAPKQPAPEPEHKPLPEPEKNISKSEEPPPPVKPKETRKPAPIKKVAEQPVRNKSQVAAPKLDIPLDGTGAAFASVPGQDSRLTAPPVKWDVEQKPAPPKSAPINSRLVAVSRVMPTYPWRAKSLGIEGWVKLEVIVSTDGAVAEANVIDDKPKDMFAEAAVQAIKQWRFKPAFVEGQAVEQRAIQLLEFRLKN